MIKVYNFIIQFRVHIFSLGVLGFFLVFRSMHGEITFQAVNLGINYFLLFFGIYLFNQVYDDNWNSPKKRQQASFLSLALFALPEALVFSFFPFKTFIIFFLAGLLLYLYSIPLFKNFRIKSHWSTKLLFTVSSYSAMTIFVPASLLDEFSFSHIFAVAKGSADFIAFVVGFTLLADYRDIEDDRRRGYHTIPVCFGKIGTMVFIFSCTFLALYFLTAGHHATSRYAGLLIMLFLVILYLTRLPTKKFFNFMILGGNVALMTFLVFFSDQ